MTPASGTEFVVKLWVQLLAIRSSSTNKAIGDLPNRVKLDGFGDSPRIRVRTAMRDRVSRFCETPRAA